MSEINFEYLIAALRQDAALRDDLRSRASQPVAALEWARGKGYSLSLAEAAELVAGLDELSDQELEQAAGGDDPWSPPKP